MKPTKQNCRMKHVFLSTSLPDDKLGKGALFTHGKERCFSVHILLCIIGTSRCVSSPWRLCASVFSEAQGSISAHKKRANLGLACPGIHGILTLGSRILSKLSRRFVHLAWPGTSVAVLPWMEKPLFVYITPPPRETTPK